MARKRTHDDAPRTKLVSVRLREQTFARLTDAAAAASLTRAGYVERLIEDGAVEVKHVATDAPTVALVNELKRLGNNLNQIAHNVNCGLCPEESAVARVTGDIVRTLAATETTRRWMKDAMAALPVTGYSQPERKVVQTVEEVLEEPKAPAAPVLPKPVQLPRPWTYSQSLAPAPVPEARSSAGTPQALPVELEQMMQGLLNKPAAPAPEKARTPEPQTAGDKPDDGKPPRGVFSSVVGNVWRRKP
jgi:hypothetical protein